MATDFCSSSSGVPSRHAISSSVSAEDDSLASQFHSVMNDHEFLLRSAEAHDWDTVVCFCQFLEDIFTLSVPDRVLQWQKNKIFAAKHQLTHKDQWGNTALHAACYNSPPPRVVRAILNAAANATASATHLTHTKPLQVHTMLSRDHSTPLLVACATGASLEVIQALLDPPQGMVSGGSMVGVADKQGSTPLSELAVHYELQRNSPLYANSYTTSLPLDQVQLIPVVTMAVTTTTQQQDNNSGLLDIFQSKLEALFQAAWRDTFPSQPFISMVHGLANVATSCPPVVTRLILRGYPHMIGFTNRHGLLPLHLTVSQVPTRQTHHASFVTRHAYCVEQLLEAYPSSARTMISNNKGGGDGGGGGRSPLLQAIASGWFWHATTKATTTSTTSASGISNIDNNSQKSNTNKGPVQVLWEQDPEGTLHLDPVTGLSPLLLAATSTWSTTLTQRREEQRGSSSLVTSTTFSSSFTEQEAQEQILQVDTLFHLLRLNPQVLAECITSVI